MEWLKQFTAAEIIAMVFVAGVYAETLRTLSRRVAAHDVAITEHGKEISKLDERTKEL